MDKFVPSIKKKYKDRLINREKQWPPCHSNKLVKLELVEREKGEGSSANTQRGREDKRTPLAYGDLFKEESGKKAVRKVLVEGDAGIGKTTLSTSISEDWSRDKLFKEYELLLLFPLRHKKVASAGSLPELLQLLHPSPGVCESVARYLEEGEGEKVVIIADGWDEVSESNQQERSFLYQLLFETFPLMSVVVTSRPSASGPLHRLPCIDRFVEIKGFSKEDIKEYIKSEFPSDEKKAGDLLEQLESNPLVESVCSVPLNCAIVCHLWRCLEDTLPSTMTQLYTKIILNVMFRNIQKNDAFKYVQSLSNFNALPKDLQQPFWRLCEFAFQMLKKNQIVFSQEELAEFLPRGLALDDKILCFGLLQSVETVLETGHGVSFHFLHLTFQEFLASLYLSRQPPETQLEVFRAHCSEPHFTLIWRLFFGICFFNTKLETKCDIKQVVHYVANKRFYFVDELSLCHCAFEAQNDVITNEVVQFQTIFRTFIRSFGSPLTAHDCAAILYVIANMQECSGMWIYFSNSGVREKQIKTLTNILSSKHGKLQVSSLNLSGNKLTDKCASDLFHRASAAFQSLTKLNLSDNRIGSESIKSIASTLAKSSCSGCQLDLSDNPLGVSGLQILENVVRDNLLSKLGSLDLVGSLTSDADTNAAWLTTFVEALPTHCPHLHRLNLSENNNLGVPGASALARVISKLHHQSQNNGTMNVDFLSIMCLNKTNLGDQGLRAFVESLECVHHFLRLLLNDNIIHATGIASLADAVCSGKVVMGECIDLNLSGNPLGLEGTLAVGRMLSSSHCQPRKVVLSRCKLTTDGGGLPNTDSLNVGINISGETVRDVGQKLCQMPQNNTIAILRLDGNSFTGEGIHILAGFMHLCPCLEYLSSSECGITSDDLLLLLDKLTQLKSSSPSLCSKLETWYLDSNKIDDSGVYGLINHLPSLFPCVDDIKFYLYGNPVSREVETKLEEEIKRRKEVRCYSSPVVSLCVILLCISVVVCFCIILCDCVYILILIDVSHMLTALFQSSTATDSEEEECLSSTPSSETDSEEEDNSFSSTVANSEELVGPTLSVSPPTYPKPHPPSVSPPIHLPVDHQDGI